MRKTLLSVHTFSNFKKARKGINKSIIVKTPCGSEDRSGRTFKRYESYEILRGDLAFEITHKISLKFARAVRLTLSKTMKGGSAIDFRDYV